MSAVLVVYAKEVRESLRDRRTLVNTLLTGPLMAPLLFALVVTTAISRHLEKAEIPLEVPVVGAERAPNLIEALKQQGLRIKSAPADPERAVREQDAELVLRVPEGYRESWSKGEPVQLELIYDSSQSEAQGSVARLRAGLERYGQRTAALRLVARGISPVTMHPVVVAERDQSTPQSRAGIMFGMLPYFFILGAFIGGMALAIDTTAGERERQSLEPLFANPVPRWQLLLGKLLATCSFSLTTVLISILAFSVTGRFLPMQKLGMVLELGPRFTLYAVVGMMPLVALVASLQTLVSGFAKSYREAQTYLSLLMFVPIIPSMMLSLLPVKAELWMYAVPLMGQHLTILRMMRGDGVSPQALLISVLCTSLAALLAGLLTARVYQSERLAISA